MRHFRIDGGKLRSSREIDQLDTPGAVVGVYLPDDQEQLIRLIKRAYTLGRKDKAADIRAALREP